MNKTAKDLYSILGLSSTATEKEIKSAYRKLAKKYHPDTNQGNKAAQEKFQKVSEAYNILSDSKKRRLYDKFGMAAFDGSMGEDPEAFAARFNSYRGGSYSGGSYNGNSYNGNFHNDFNTGFSPDFDFTRQGTHYRRRNPDGSYSEYFYSNGADEDWINDLLKNFGNGSRRTRSGPQPDPIGFEEIKPGFQKKGNDIYVTEYIPYTTAVLGGKVYFKTLSGLVECTVPAGTQSGSRIRLKGKGLATPGNPGRYGDEYVTIRIIVPTRLSPAEREALLNLQKAQTIGGCA